MIELTPSMKRLTSELEQEIKAGTVEVNLEPRGSGGQPEADGVFPFGHRRHRSFHLLRFSKKSRAP